MRTLVVFAPVALLFALAGCAAGAPQGTYSQQEVQLAADCQARGGILAPTGQQSGRPQNDNVCEIRSQTGRAPTNPG